MQVKLLNVVDPVIPEQPEAEQEPEKPENKPEITSNVGKQTSLRFKKERQKESIWFVKRLE